MNNLGDIQKRFSAAFAQSWKMTASELNGLGLKVGAAVRNRNNDVFRITAIKPRVHNFGAPAGAIVVNGVKYRADRTWGTHEHWAGDIGDLTVIQRATERAAR